MTEGKRSGRTWLAYGCTGCAGIVGIIVILLGIISGVAALRARSESVVDRQLKHEFPATGGEAAPQDAPAAADPAEPGVLADARGRLVLRLSGADFTLEPAAAGQPLSVDAAFDEKSYELVERVETPEGQPWLYEVRFRSTRGMLINTLTQLFGGKHPRVRIHVPADVPLELDVAVDNGALEAKIGGLWLIEADFSVDRGATVMEVGSPLRQPMRRLSMSGSMGAFVVSGLGNASPARLDLESSMGGMVLDMGGLWLQDSAITVRSSRSGGEIRLPDDVRVEGLDASFLEPTRVPETPRPTLRFSPDSQLDDITIER